MIALLAQAPKIETYTAATLPAWIKAGRARLDATPIARRKTVAERLRGERAIPTLADLLPCPPVFRTLRLGQTARIKPGEWTAMVNEGERFFVSKPEGADFDVDRTGRITAVGWIPYRGKDEARAKGIFLARIREAGRTLGPPVAMSRRYYPAQAQSVVRADWPMARTLAKTSLNRTRTGVFTVRAALNLLRL